MPSKNSSHKGKLANGEPSRSPIRSTRITLWQQRALDRGRTPLPEAPGVRPWLQEQSSDGAAPAKTAPLRPMLRPLAPAPAPDTATVTVTLGSSKSSSSTAVRSAEPSYQTPSSSPPDDKSLCREEEERDNQ